MASRAGALCSCEAACGSGPFSHGNDATSASGAPAPDGASLGHATGTPAVYRAPSESSRIARAGSSRRSDGTTRPLRPR
ncbi:hypothetical protein BE20_14475 [Sorangium cellulosum]|nr:hypothetical protein BE20_14475 [Sorangium cellulosum]